MGVSLNPDDAVAGGLLADVNVTFVKVRFNMFDYGGAAQAVPAIHAAMETPEGESAEQYWSMGSSKDWMPSEDGTMLDPVGTASQLRQGSNGMIFLEQLISSGFPKDRLGDDISVLDGLQAHVIRIPAPARPGIKKKEGDDREQTILVVDEILQLPWEATDDKVGKGKAAGKGKATGKAKAAPVPDEVTNGLAERAEEIVMEALSTADSASIDRKALAVKIYSTLKGDDDRTALMNLIGSEDFLRGERPWQYDGKAVSIGG
jgi:hypothetical protein